MLTTDSKNCSFINDIGDGVHNEVIYSYKKYEATTDSLKKAFKINAGLMKMLHDGAGYLGKEARLQELHNHLYLANFYIIRALDVLGHRLIDEYVEAELDSVFTKRYIALFGKQEGASKEQGAAASGNPADSRPGCDCSAGDCPFDDGPALYGQAFSPDNDSADSANETPF